MASWQLSMYCCRLQVCEYDRKVLGSYELTYVGSFSTSPNSSLRRYEVGAEGFPARDHPQRVPSYTENHLRWGDQGRVDVENPGAGTSLSSSGENPTASLRSSASAFSDVVTNISSSATSLRNTEERVLASPNVQEAEARLKEQELLKPIKFKDAVGRKFSFPFHLCSTWMVCLANPRRSPSKD